MKNVNMLKWTIMGLAILTVAACDGLPSPHKQNFDDVPDLVVAGTSATELTPDRMEAYGRMVQSFSPRAKQSKARYLEWCDMESGPTGNERNILGLYTLNNRILDDAKKEIPQEPVLSIDKFAADYIHAGQLLYEIINETDYYYDQENYKDDNMAKGKELHSKLMDAFLKFEMAESLFIPEYEKKNREITESINTELKKQGKTLVLDIQDITQQCEVLLDELLPLASDFKNSPTEAQLASIESKIYKIETDNLAFEKNSTSTPEEKLNEQFQNENELPHFISEVKTFLKAAKDIHRQLKSKEKRDRSFERNLDVLSDQYSRVIQRMQFCRIIRP